MNKAFVKEPEQGQGFCPRCASLGTPVGPETLQAHVPPERLQDLTDSAFFCAFARCSVVYFDHFERVVEVTEVTTPVYPKTADSPLCACFGLTQEDVEEDVREGGVTRVRALVEKSKSPAARCVLAAPSGQCCVPEVQRYYMKVRSNWGGGP